MEEPKYKVGIIIQARMNSSRMPNKILKSFYKGKSILEIQIENLSKLNLPIIVATTENKLDDEIITFCVKKNIKYYRGNEYNVLIRFKEVIDIYNFDYIVRVCSDNPFLNVRLIKKQLKYADNKNDYVSYALVDNTPTIKTHYGFFAELIKSESLNTIITNSKNKDDLEHVSKFIYENTNLFKIKYLALPKYIESQKNIRLTIDTQKDFEIASEIYSKIQEKSQDIKHILSYICSNPNFIKTMEYQINKHLK